MNDTIIDLQANITHISKQGLKLCVEDSIIGIAIENRTLNAHAVGVKCDNISDSGWWVVVFDQTLPLKRQLNQIQVNIMKKSPKGNGPIQSFRFYLNVGGDTVYTSECYYCWRRTQAAVFVDNLSVDTLTWQNNSYTIRLFSYGEDTLKEVKIAARTVNKGDLDTITIVNPTFNGLKWTFSKTVPFAVISGNPMLHNGTTEADYNDRIVFYWRNPRESLDTASSSIIVKSPPNRFEIHNKTGEPDATSKYSTAPASDSIFAGTPVQLYAKLFSNTKWMSDYENNQSLYKKITWKCTDINGNPDPSLGFLKYDSVAHNTFHPGKAYRCVDITARVTIPGLNPVTEKIRLYIKPGVPTQLVIEGTRDLNAIPLSRSDYSPIALLGTQTTKTAYALFRDSLGNFCYLASGAVWTSDAPSIATVDPGPNVDGVIHRQGAGELIIHAMQSGMEDTAVVLCTPHTVDDRFRIHTSGDTSDIKNLDMTTNQDTTLFISGFTSANLWIPIAGDWSISDSSVVDPFPPKQNRRWSFSPSKPDTGMIIVSFDGTSGKLHDTVHYQFRSGEPVQVRFTLLTPDSQLIAGRSIKGAVEILNKDGFVPVLWKYPAAGGSGGADSAHYTDTLDAGTPGIKGYIPNGRTFDLSGALLSSCNFKSKKVTVAQWFQNGIDTVDFVLYNTGSRVGSPAPKPHKFKVYLDTLSISTNEFIVKPGHLDTIVVNPDTIPNLNPNDPAFIITGTAYDEFGNYLPSEIFYWTSDPSLIDFSFNAQSTQLLIDPSLAAKSQEGWIYAKGISDTNVLNKVYIKIVGSKPKLIKAVTRDNNGNGFLDGIEIFLDKPVTLPPGYVPLNVIVEKNTIFLSADSLTILPLSDNMKLLLHLNEVKSVEMNVPQTGWTPLLTMIDCDSIQQIARVTCEDGAAPVLWSVVKDVRDAYDSRKDVVTVTFSENIKAKNGNDIVTFNCNIAPELAFKVWITETEQHTTMLSQIAHFKSQLDNRCVFMMTNGQELDSSYLMNINYLTTHICDAKGNLPHEKNRKMRVRVIGALPTEEEPGHCGQCGSGTELAFFPAIGIQIFSLFRRFKKRKK